MTALLGPIAAVAAALGLVFGSFFNVVIWRVPRRLSVVAPPSACPRCDTPIRARDNVPVLSWLLLRGRCRDCSEPISPRYPAIELLTAGVFATVALAFVPSVLAAGTSLAIIANVLEAFAFLVLAAASIILTAIDLAEHRLPDAIVIPTGVAALVLLGIAGLLAGDPDALLRAAAAAVGSAAFYFVLAFIRPGAMGMGDVKLAAVLGLYLGYLGWPELAVGVAGAFLLGGVVGVVLIASRRVTRDGGIPFGPWMFAGAWISVFAGESIADAYLAFVGIT